MTTERRSAPLEIRARGRKLEGYAALFNTEARIDAFTETIAPGAFAGSLAGDVLALVDHDAGRVLARTKSKTLRLSEDTRGLAFDLDLPSTSYANDVLALVERNDVGGMSFGFIVAKDGERWDGNRRTLRTVDLKEISVVSAWPAYDGTVVNARANRNHGSDFRLVLARRYLETMR
jgi:HK97 family phage prohead protease